MAADSSVRVVFLGDSGSAQRATKSLEHSFSALGRGAKVAATAIGVGFAAALGASVAAAISFDKSMRNVQSITKSSEKQFQSLSKSVLKMSKDTAQAPKQLADGLYDIVSSGFKAQDALLVLHASAKAATAGLTDTATSVKAVTAVLNAYHLPASKAAEVSDVLFQTVNKGVLTFEELASQIGDVIPVAAALKVPVTDVGGALATVTLHGVSAAEAATQVKQVLVSMLKPSRDLGAEFKTLGYASAQTALQQKGLVGVVTDLSTAAHGNQATIASWFPNVRALGGFMNIAGKNIGQFTANVNSMKHATDGAGATTLAFNEQAKSISFQWQRAKASLTAAAIPIGQLLFPALMKGAQGVEFLAGKITQYMPMIQAATQRAMRAIQQAWQQFGAPTFARMVAASQSAAQKVIQNWGQVTAAAHRLYQQVKSALAPLQPAFEQFTAAARAMAPGFRSTAAIIEANAHTMGAVVLAVLRAISYGLEGVAIAMRITAPVFNAGMAGMAAIAAGVDAVVIGALGGIVAALGAVRSAVDSVRAAWDWLKQEASHAIHLAVNISVSGLGTLQAAANLAAKVGGSVVSAIGHIPHAAGGIIPMHLGTPGKDSVPAMLTPGEMVLNERQQQMLGGQAMLARMFGFNGGGIVPGLTQFFATGGIAKPRRRRPGANPKSTGNRAVHRTPSYDSRVTSLVSRISGPSGVDSDIDFADREYNEMSDKFSVDDRNLQFIGTNTDGTEYIDQAAVDQRSGEIQKLLAKKEELRALYQRKAQLLRQLVAVLRAAIKAVTARIKHEAEMIRAQEQKIKADQKAITDLNNRIYKESQKKRVKHKDAKGHVTYTGGPDAAAIRGWRHQLVGLRSGLSTDKKTLTGEKDRLGKDNNLLGNYRTNLGEEDQALRFLPLDIRDNVGSPEYQLRGELADIDPAALGKQVAANNAAVAASAAGSGGSGANPDQTALLAALLAQLGQSNLALSLQGIQLPILGSFQKGTINVPETGAYLLHGGERVTPSGVPYAAGGDGGSIGDITIQLVVDDAQLEQLIHIGAVRATSDISVKMGQAASSRARGGRI
jgi:TP901 family phage tail tape measure protein